MLYEYAMTPDLFDSKILNSNDASEINLVEILHGIAQFGLLANLHKDRWILHVEERLNSLSPHAKAKRTKLSLIVKRSTSPCKAPKVHDG